MSKRKASASKTAKKAKSKNGSRSGGFVHIFTQFANSVARTTGRPATFVLCCLLIVVWAVSGPVFGFSDTWQLVINTGTTIITFLMVFLIQNTQNRDGAAIQAKLDELIRALEGPRNAFVGIEHLTDEELDEIREACEKDAEAGDHKERAHTGALHSAFERLERIKRSHS